jgi:outer membrane biogenesis lipoprotein LolB
VKRIRYLVLLLLFLTACGSNPSVNPDKAHWDSSNWDQAQWQ